MGIRKLAEEKYGDDPFLYGGQRDGFIEGYKLASFCYQTENKELKDKIEQLEKEKEYREKLLAKIYQLSEKSND